MDIMFAAEQMAQAQAAALYYMNQAVSQGVTPTGPAPAPTQPTPGFGLMPTPVMTPMSVAGPHQPPPPPIISMMGTPVSNASYGALATSMGMPLTLAGQQQHAALLAMAEREGGHQDKDREDKRYAEDSSSYHKVLH